MSGLFGRPKKPDPIALPSPAIPDPIPVPVVQGGVGDIAQREAIKRSGFKKTILTGALEPESKKKRVLG